MADAARARAYERATTAAVILITSLLAVLLAAPGKTVVTKYLNDLLVFLDGAHRVVSGQMPHRDYHTPIGAVADLLPTVGFVLTGSFGAAMPAGFAVLMLLLAPLMAHVLTSRLGPALAVCFAIYLGLILAAPANLGESSATLSFGMFYNRIGWAAIALLFVLSLPPRRGSNPISDGLCAALLTLLMIYIKISFGVVAIALLALMMFDERARWCSAFALAVTAIVTVGLQAFLGLPKAYLADLLIAGPARGAVQGGLARLLVNVEENLSDYALFAGVVAIAWLRLRDLRTIALLGFCAAGGLFMINQSFQVTGIVVLGAGAVVATEAVSRITTEGSGRREKASLIGLYVLLLLLVVPIIANRAVALVNHVSLGTGPATRSAPMPRLAGVLLAENGSQYDALYTARYVATIEDGVRALSALSSPLRKVGVLDFVNPFSVGLGLQPARGENSLNQYGNTFSGTSHHPAGTVLGDVQILMDPKWRIDPPTANAYHAIYRFYIASHFELVDETEFWIIYARRRSDLPP
jgi:hypothetical protein